MKIFVLISLLFLGLVSFGCSSWPSAKEKLDPKLLEDNIFLTQRDLADLERGKRYDYGSYFMAVKVRPITYTSRKQEIEKGTIEQAYKEKWPNDKTKSALQLALQSAKEESNRKTCFSVAVITSDSKASETPAWYMYLSTIGIEKEPMELTPFLGFTDSQFHSYVSSVPGAYLQTVETYETKTHNYY